MKRALLVAAAATTVAAALAFTVSPISPQAAWAALTAPAIKEGPNTPAPQTRKKALKLLRADVTKFARDYSHKRYRAVCSDLTKRERKHLGGTSKCMLEAAGANAFAPTLKFTITAAKLGKSRARATVSAYVNGNKKHLVEAVVKWEGGRYRLDHQSGGWRPSI
ncbi:MAG TPA: hypothetical protein VGH79_11330 [Gaiellaceae bacterium]|jgi:hypothetical protein